MPLRRTSITVALTLALGASGCANLSDTQQGTAAGAGIGAAAGAVLGAATGGGGGRRAASGAAIGAAAGALGGYVWSNRMEQQKRQLEQATQGTGVEVTQTASNELKLNIPNDISFDVGRADIKPNFRPVLDQFAQSLRQTGGTTVRIVGHTDSSGSDAINQPLSIERADSVRGYLVNRGVEGQRMAIDGRGSREPIADNATDAGRAKNRRVEIFVAEAAPAAPPR